MFRTSKILIFLMVVFFCLSQTVWSGGKKEVKEEVAKINWNEPGGIKQRLLGQGPVQEIGPEMVDAIKKAYKLDLSGRTIMPTGYVLPEGWEAATEGVDQIVATNGGSLDWDPATVINAQIFERNTGIHIELVEMTESLAWQKILSLLMAKSTDVDLCYHPDTYLVIPQLAAANWIEPVDELWPPEAQELFPEKMLVNVKGADGKFYSSPTIIWNQYLFYRTSWLENANVEVPETWQDLIIATKKVQEWADNNLGPGHSGMVCAAGDEASGMGYVEMMTYSQGKRIMIDGAPVLNPEAWEGFNNLWLEGGMSKDSINYQWSDSPEVFAKGKAGFVITSGVFMVDFSDPEFAQAIQNDWGVTLLPAWEGVGVRGSYHASCDTWMINAFISPQKKAAAKLWIDYLRSYQYNFHELYVEGNESALLDVYEHPKVKEEVMHPDLRKQTLASAIGEVFPPKFMDAAEYLKEYNHKVVLGEIGIEEARKEVQAYWDDGWGK